MEQRATLGALTGESVIAAEARVRIPFAAAMEAYREVVAMPERDRFELSATARCLTKSGQYVDYPQQRLNRLLTRNRIVVSGRERDISGIQKLSPISGGGPTAGAHLDDPAVWSRELSRQVK